MMKKVFLTLLSAAVAILFAATAQNSRTMYVMKNGTAIHQVAVSEIDSIIFYAPEISATPTTDPGVVINGVKWATRNLDAGGTFVANPEDYGALFQWGRKADGHEQRTSTTTAVLSTTDVPSHSNFILTSGRPFDWRSPRNNTLWNASTESSPVKTANDPSPAGWRVPTLSEWQSLYDLTKVTWVWDDVKQGYTVTDISTGHRLFLPAAGSRGISIGTVGNVGSNGYYWSSSTVSGDSAGTLYFASGAVDTASSFYRSNGFSVRCVAE